MNKVRFLLPLAIIVLLSSCSGIIDPTTEPSPDPRLTGTWTGLDQAGSHRETYTFYNNSKIDRVRVLTGSGTNTTMWEYQWRNIGGSYFYRAYKFEENWTPFNIDLTNIDSDEITIDGFVLKKVK